MLYKLGYEYNIIHHTPGTKYTKHYLQYMVELSIVSHIAHSHKGHIYLLKFTSKTFERP